MSPRTQTVVTWLGRVGGIARGVVFVTTGIFLILAAIDAKPQQAKGGGLGAPFPAAKPGGTALSPIPSQAFPKTRS